MALGPLTSDTRYLPEVRDDLGEFARLLAFLDALERRAPGQISVLSSSGVLCDDVLRWANRSRHWSYYSPGKILPTANVDLRDGFPVLLLMSRYILVTVPPLIHLRPEDQRVILFPRDSLLEGRDIGRAFSMHRVAFVLEGGVKVLVFERTGPIEEEAVAALVRRFRYFYPPETGFYDRLRLLPERFAPVLEGLR